MEGGKSNRTRAEPRKVRGASGHGHSTKLHGGARGTRCHHGRGVMPEEERVPRQRQKMEAEMRSERREEDEAEGKAQGLSARGDRRPQPGPGWQSRRTVGKEGGERNEGRMRVDAADEREWGGERSPGEGEEEERRAKNKEPRQRAGVQWRGAEVKKPAETRGGSKNVQREKWTGTRGEVRQVEKRSDNKAECPGRRGQQGKSETRGGE